MGYSTEAPWLLEQLDNLQLINKVDQTNVNILKVVVSTVLAPVVKEIGNTTCQNFMMIIWPTVNKVEFEATYYVYHNDLNCLVGSYKAEGYSPFYYNL